MYSYSQGLLTRIDAVRDENRIKPARRQCSVTIALTEQRADLHLWCPGRLTTLHCTALHCTAPGDSLVLLCSTLQSAITASSPSKGLHLAAIARPHKLTVLIGRH
jgi:hypothetical protein